MADFNIPQLRNRKLSSLLLDPSVMDNYQPPAPKGLLDPAADAIGPPSVLGGLLSLDPTDYIGPQTLGKLAAGLKGLLAGGAIPMAGILRNPALQESAMKHFGTTYSPKETGFILDNGKRLDLSGRHYATGYEKQGDKFVPKAGQPDYVGGSRNVDHRELDDLVSGQGWNGLADFINQTGAVRYMPDTGISMVDTNMPNAAQIQKAVEDFRRSRTPMNVDVDTFSGSSRASQEFDRPTVDAVMGWIKNQMKPEAFK